jgi:hypothetical protein
MEDTFYVADEILKQKTPGRPFYLEDVTTLNSDNFSPSYDGDEKLAVEMSRQSAFLASGQKLKAMDCFSGAGGLTSGLDQSGAVETMWAIEFDAAAARTFKRNFPKATVYNHDVNTVLRQAFAENLGTATNTLKDSSGKPLPRLPKPGEV